MLQGQLTADSRRQTAVGPQGSTSVYSKMLCIDIQRAKGARVVNNKTKHGAAVGSWRWEMPANSTAAKWKNLTRH